MSGPHFSGPQLSPHYYRALGKHECPCGERSHYKMLRCNMKELCLYKRFHLVCMKMPADTDPTFDDTDWTCPFCRVQIGAVLSLTDRKILSDLARFQPAPEELECHDVNKKKQMTGRYAGNDDYWDELWTADPPRLQARNGLNDNNHPMITYPQHQPQPEAQFQNNVNDNNHPVAADSRVPSGNASQQVSNDINYPMATDSRPQSQNQPQTQAPQQLVVANNQGPWRVRKEVVPSAQRGQPGGERTVTTNRVWLSARLDLAAMSAADIQQHEASVNAAGVPFPTILKGRMEYMRDYEGRYQWVRFWQAWTIWQTGYVALTPCAYCTRRGRQCIVTNEIRSWICVDCAWKGNSGCHAVHDEWSLLKKGPRTVRHKKTPNQNPPQGGTAINYRAAAANAAAANTMISNYNHNTMNTFTGTGTITGQPQLPTPLQQMLQLQQQQARLGYVLTAPNPATPTAPIQTTAQNAIGPSTSSYPTVQYAIGPPTHSHSIAQNAITPTTSSFHPGPVASATATAIANTPIDGNSNGDDDNDPPPPYTRHPAPALAHASAPAPSQTPAPAQAPAPAIHQAAEALQLMARDPYHHH